MQLALARLKTEYRGYFDVGASALAPSCIHSRLRRFGATDRELVAAALDLRRLFFSVRKSLQPAAYKTQTPTRRFTRDPRSQKNQFFVLLRLDGALPSLAVR